MNPNVKRMLSIQDADFYYSATSKPIKIVQVNASSVSVIQECMRKAHYLLDKGLRSDSDESEAQVFGTAIHAGLAVFYGCDPSNRVLSDVLDAFMAYEARLQGAHGTKRSVENGRKILENYFNTYRSDPWVVHRDSSGPFVERSFEHTLHEQDGLRVDMFGTIDAVLRNTETGELVVCDHKTTSSLGELFYKGIKPRTQFAAYAWAGRKMGLPIKDVMMNGIQVAKTKWDLSRCFAEYGPQEDAEMKETVLDAVNRYLVAKQNSSWPMSTSNCVSWGGCQYLEICSAKPEQRKFVTQSKYGMNNG